MDEDILDGMEEGLDYLETPDWDDWPDWIGWNYDADGNSDNAVCDDQAELGAAEYDSAVEECFGDEGNYD